MRNVTSFIGGVIFLLIAFGLAHAHSDWAKYQFKEVPDYVNVPQNFIFEDGTLDCCACHWNTNHAGPGKGFCE